MSSLTVFPDENQKNQKMNDIENWRRSVSWHMIPAYAREDDTCCPDVNRLAGLHGGSEDADLGGDIWWETIDDEIYWIFPIYLGRSRGDYSRNSHLLEFHESGESCHPLNPGQFQRLAELQGWADLQRTARFRVQENIGSLLRGSRQAIFKLLHKIEEYQLFPGLCFEGLLPGSWSTGRGSRSSSHLGLQSPEASPPWTIGPPPPSMVASPRRSLTATERPPPADPLAIVLPYSLARELSAPESLISPLSSTSTTPARLSIELDEQRIHPDDFIPAPSRASVDSALWEELGRIPLDGPDDRPPQRASSEPGAASANPNLAPAAPSEGASDDCRWFATATRRVSWPPAAADAIGAAGSPLDTLAAAALWEWERELEMRERRVADEVARRRASVARLEREAARCEALFALGFSRGRVDAEMRLAERDAVWFGDQGWEWW
jgi:hypothetical protein